MLKKCFPVLWQQCLPFVHFLRQRSQSRGLRLSISNPFSLSTSATLIFALRGLLLESTRSTLQRAAFGNTVFGTQKFAPTTTTPRGVTVVPWNSMATEFVQQILRKGERLSQRNGRFSGPQMMIVIGIVFAINRLY